MELLIIVLFFLGIIMAVIGYYQGGQQCAPTKVEFKFMDMTIEEATGFFENIPAIAKKLQTLNDVGLSYIRLGQAATTLSGGEAQRVKLSKELSKRDTGNTLYILDEPSIGLHQKDIYHLLKMLKKLRDQGNTVPSGRGPGDVRFYRHSQGGRAILCRQRGQGRQSSC